MFVFYQGSSYFYNIDSLFDEGLFWSFAGNLNKDSMLRSGVFLTDN